MNYKRYSLRVRALSLTAAAVAVFSAAPAWAVSAALYVSPASGPVPVGSYIPVQIRVNSGTDPVNAVEAVVTYNSSQLSFDSFSATGSAYSLDAHKITTAGSLDFVRATGGGEPAAQGDNLFGTIMFKALTTAGTASVSIAKGSHVVRSTDSVDIEAGAAAASGPVASATNAPKAQAYPTLAQAQAAGPTPAPVTAAQKSGATASPAAAGHVTMAASPTPVPASGLKVADWKSPIVLGGGFLVLFIAGVMAYLAIRSRSGLVRPGGMDSGMPMIHPGQSDVAPRMVHPEQTTNSPGSINDNDLD